MSKLFYLFLVVSLLSSGLIIYNTKISTKETEESFDGISKATKPKKGLNLYFSQA
ncbi:MAG: hypothetical protein WCG42_06030 [Parachlamydiaceae bacterium]